MFPHLVLFGKAISLYQIFAILGYFVSGIYACLVCRKNGRDDNNAIIFFLVIAVGVLLGAHLLYGILNFRLILYVIENISKVNSLKLAFEIFIEIFGGSIFYGGLLGGLLAAAIYFRKNPENKFLADIVAPSIPLFHFFGRIGCFLSGCCYGIESFFGFTSYHSPIESANGVSRFPVQLLEALFNLGLFFILDYLRKKEFFKNRIVFVYLAAYSAGRFLLEFLRGDSYRGFLLGLSTSQIISILIFCFVTGFIAITRFRKPGIVKI